MQDGRHQHIWNTFVMSFRSMTERAEWWSTCREHTRDTSVTSLKVSGDANVWQKVVRRVNKIYLIRLRRSLNVRYTIIQEEWNTNPLFSTAYARQFLFTIQYYMQKPHKVPTHLTVSLLLHTRPLSEAWRKEPRNLPTEQYTCSCS